MEILSISGQLKRNELLPFSQSDRFETYLYLFSIPLCLCDSVTL